MQRCCATIPSSIVKRMNRLILPNEADGFIAEEMRSRLQAGHVVRIAFGGNSMWPTLDGRSDTVELTPVGADEPLHEGEIYLFRYKGRCVVHRLVHQEKDWCTMRGDHNEGTEQVMRSEVWAHLTAVVHADGSREACDSRRFRRRSRRAMARRDVRLAVTHCFGRQQRRWMRWLYLAALLLLMWLPLGGIPLENFVLGIRLDHLIHASVYLPCAFFFCDLRLGGKRRCNGRLLAACLLLAAITETVQYLLPYRGFDINDLVANFLGVTLGWVVARHLIKA